MKFYPVLPHQYAPPYFPLLPSPELHHRRRLQGLGHQRRQETVRPATPPATPRRLPQPLCCPAPPPPPPRPAPAAHGSCPPGASRGRIRMITRRPGRHFRERHGRDVITNAAASTTASTAASTSAVAQGCGPGRPHPAPPQRPSPRLAPGRGRRRWWRWCCRAQRAALLGTAGSPASWRRCRRCCWRRYPTSCGARAQSSCPRPPPPADGPGSLRGECCGRHSHGLAAAAGES